MKDEARFMSRQHNNNNLCSMLMKSEIFLMLMMKSFLRFYFSFDFCLMHIAQERSSSRYSTYDTSAYMYMRSCQLVAGGGGQVACVGAVRGR